MKYLLLTLIIALAKGGHGGKHGPKPDFSQLTSCTAEGNECTEGQSCLIKDGKDSGYCFVTCQNDEQCGDNEKCGIRRDENEGICKPARPERTECGHDTDCSEGETCMFKKEDSETGVCKIPLATCTTNEDCSEGEDCMIRENQDKGVCKRSREDKQETNEETRRALRGKKGNKRPKGPSCSSDDDCEQEGAVCIKGGKTDGQCSVPCSTTDDCQDGDECRIKNGKGVCKRVSVSCSTDEDCGEGSTCRIKKDEETGVCKRRKPGDKPETKETGEFRRNLKRGRGPKGSKCATDNDCDGDSGEVCMMKEGKTEGRCVPKTLCSTDDQCDEGETCKMNDADTGFCKRAPVPCTTDADCKEGSTCRLSEDGSGGFCKCDKQDDEKQADTETLEFRRLLRKGGKKRGPKGPRCTSDDECDSESGEVCIKKKEDSTHGHCDVPKVECSSDGDCNAESGEVCMKKEEATKGFCKRAPVPCTTGDDCEEGSVCRIKEGKSKGVCKKDKPSSDEDAETLESRRLLGKGGGKRRPKGPRCTSDHECDSESGEICIIKDYDDEEPKGRCGIPKTICSTDEDCADGELCGMRENAINGVCKKERHGEKSKDADTEDFRIVRRKM